MYLKKIRRAIREGRYEFTSHALEEMDEDDILESYVQRAILQGTVVGTLTDDPTGRLRIITVYVLEENGNEF